jgi:hypothetical protein
MSRYKELDRLLINYKRRLQLLREQESQLGYNTPPEIRMEIEDIEAKIAELEAERQALDDEAATASQTEAMPGKVFVDDFKNGTKYWPLGNMNEEGRTQQRSIVNEVYRWEVATPKTGMVALPSKLPAVSNFDLHLNLRLNEGSNLIYGLYFRYSNKGNYYFLLNDDGRYKFTTWNAQSGETQDKIPWSLSLAINVGGRNTLRVAARESLIRLYLNGELAAEISDDLLTTGTVGLAAWPTAENFFVLEIYGFRLVLP